MLEAESVNQWRKRKPEQFRRVVGDAMRIAVELPTDTGVPGPIYESRSTPVRPQRVTLSYGEMERIEPAGSRPTTLRWYPN